MIVLSCLVFQTYLTVFMKDVQCESGDPVPSGN